MNLNVFTLIHILISLAGILSGLVVAGGWLAGRALPGMTSFFLATTALTSITGFFFPFTTFTPAHVFGVLSLLALAAAYFAQYFAKLAGGWRRIFAITALLSLYLNFFVLVAQLFNKTPALKALAPNQSEPPFGISQFLLLVFFAVLGRAAVRGFIGARQDP